MIDEYTYDKQKAPQSLQDLVAAGYLRDIPIDPITGSNQTWHIIMEDALQSVNQTEPGIFDVKSGSDKRGWTARPTRIGSIALSRQTSAMHCGTHAGECRVSPPSRFEFIQVFKNCRLPFPLAQQLSDVLAVKRVGFLMAP